jgi:hypothetical protein
MFSRLVRSTPLRRELRRPFVSVVEASSLFGRIDVDNSGEISREEFDAVIDAMEHNELREYGKVAFRVFDTDGNGMIDAKEFHDTVNRLDEKELNLLKSGVARNELSNTAEGDKESSILSSLVNRFAVTAEVAISKIAPAGFGWQLGSEVAGSMGLQADQLGFFLSAGVGDALGVAIGHYVWFFVKDKVYAEQDMTAQAHTSALLGSACILSGTAWQPVVNFLHDSAHLEFNGCAVGATMACGLAFYTGLRLFRGIYSPMLSGVAPASYANLKADAWLSLAVGGGTGAFVGTDVSFVGADGVDTNWLRPAFGVEEGLSPLQGMLTAGASTATGFSAFQSVLNVTLPAGKNWVD